MVGALKTGKVVHTYINIFIIHNTYSSSGVMSSSFFLPWMRM